MRLGKMLYKPFKGWHSYEWQVLCFVLQWQHWDTEVETPNTDCVVPAWYKLKRVKIGRLCIWIDDVWRSDFKRWWEYKMLHLNPLRHLFKVIEDYVHADPVIVNDTGACWDFERGRFFSSGAEEHQYYVVGMAGVFAITYFDKYRIRREIC